MKLSFSHLEANLIIHELITQTVVKYDDFHRIQKGDVFPLVIEGLECKNFMIYVDNIRITSIGKLSNEDVYKNGYMYRPHFISSMFRKGITANDVVLKIDFRVLKNV